MREPFLGAAEVDEVTAQDVARLERRLVRADGTSDRERLLADRERLLVAPRKPQSASEPREHLRALRRRRLHRNELDRVL
jgi:hypothetical protein